MQHITKNAKVRERLAKASAEYRNQISVRNIMEGKKKEEKEKRETAYFFVSEIERIKAQMDRLSQSNNPEDKIRIEYYKEMLKDCTKKMTEKFSEKEIEKAQKKFANKPNPFLFGGNGGNGGR